MAVSSKALACALCLFAGAASAAESGFYVGVLGGRTDYDFEPQPQLPLAPVPGLTPRFEPAPNIVYPSNDLFVTAPYPFAISPLGWPPNADSEATAWGLLVGYRIVPYAAVELSYLNLGELTREEVSQFGFSSAPITVISEYELETTGPALSALGVWPITPQWEIYVRAGVLFADMEIATSFSSSSPQFINSSASTTFGSEALLWGGGAQFNWGEHWSIRLDYQRFEDVGEANEAGKADIDLVSLGFLFRI